ncbi:hypothetical protein PV726_32685 [Streptomyces europaeiscabiei]|uniref:hypothetical protein n=1 Tax=Streptomyces europaeiscabiei TaxID=146819 RepID=UPI0029BA01B8|nr:hypothetical protein [Streptomyces europaeiscabiei]MDX3695013.1 hypothetical protein [Streptomyces europaeiscabiei]
MACAAVDVPDPCCCLLPTEPSSAAPARSVCHPADGLYGPAPEPGPETGGERWPLAGNRLRTADPYRV